MSKKGFNQFKSFASDNLGGSGKNLKFQLPLIAGALLLWFAGQSIYYGNHFFISVDVGHYAVKFNKLWGGLTAARYREGYNFKFPFIEIPIIYNVQTRED